MQLPDLEELANQFSRWIAANKRPLVYLLMIFLSLWLLLQMREVALLLMLSYLVAVLVEPLVRRMAAKPTERAAAILFIMTGAVLLFVIFIFGVVPPVVRQYSQFLTQLPEYFDQLLVRTAKLLHNVGVKEPDNAKELAVWVRKAAGELGPEQIKKIAKNILEFLLQGYSITLTLLNIALLPIFIFYISVELNHINQFLLSLFSDPMKDKLRSLSIEILDLIYAFFRGQMTVSAVMALLYAIGLSLVGVQSGMAIGLLAGILNIVPYLGLLSGVALSFISIAISGPTFWGFFSAGAVFAGVQAIEGFILTPKIVGSKTGIHPLGVMVALLIGGQLLGILGLVIAIPAAAAARVIFRFLLAEVKEGNASKFEA